jgi:hypothetical protein
MERVSDITIVVGPPGPEDERQKFEGWSKTSGKPKEEIWLEYVHDVIRAFTNRQQPGSPSKLDEFLSHAFGIQVRVDEPFLTYMMTQGSVRNPAVILYTNRITGPNTTTLTVDWSASSLRDSIGSMFGLLLKAEWVRTLVAYEP